MKYILIILLFVSSFCYGQTSIMPATVKINLHGIVDTIIKKDTTKFNVVGNAVLGTSMWNLHSTTHAHDTNDNPLYDTSFGIVETYLRDGSFLRGWGFEIDSLIIREGFATVVPNALSITGYSAKFDYDTVRIAIKVFSQPLACYIDNKKYYKFIPIKYLQNMDIYEDEHISISPNENYKKDEK